MFLFAIVDCDFTEIAWLLFLIFLILLINTFCIFFCQVALRLPTRKKMMYIEQNVKLKILRNLVFSDKPFNIIIENPYPNTCQYDVRIHNYEKNESRKIGNSDVVSEITTSISKRDFNSGNFSASKDKPAA